MFGPYRPPWPAFAHLRGYRQQDGAEQPAGLQFRLIEQTPDQFQGGQAGLAGVRARLRGNTLRRGIAWVATAPLADGSWFFYCSYAGAPADRFPRELRRWWRCGNPGA